MQKPAIELESARDLLQYTLAVMKQQRDKCVDKFSSIYDETCGLAEELGIEIKITRIDTRQNHRPNHPTNDAKEYYRQSLLYSYDSECYRGS